MCGSQHPYSRSPKVGNPIASILKSNVKGIPALFVLNPVSNFLGFTIGLGLRVTEPRSKPSPSDQEAGGEDGESDSGLGL